MNTPPPVSEDAARSAYTRRRRKHWDRVAQSSGRTLGGYYHRRMEEIFGFLVSPGQRVLELGCGNGDLLAALQPSLGVGLDFSKAMLRRAARRHPNLNFVCADALDAAFTRPFDVIVLNDLVNDLWDVQRLFALIKDFCHDRTRIVCNGYSRLWQPLLGAARSLGLATPVLSQNWLTPEDLAHIALLEGFEPVKVFSDVLLPVHIPLVTMFCNKVLAKVFPFRYLDLTNIMVLRRVPETRIQAKEPTVSVVVAARNEEGNIPELFRRIPDMGGGTEIVFVEGGSADDTYGAIQRQMAAHPDRNVRLFRQEGKGKGDAVRKGFSQARGDVLMILDADMTVVPEDLPRFYNALAGGKGEFINGVRLVYPLEDRAMRFFNLLGNKFFSLAFSWLLGQPVKDTLCGTKVLRRSDYARIAANRSYFGDFDPFGDFDLIFGAAKQNLKIVDLPIRYRERRWGDTNIQRWRHGMILLRMVAFAARRIKFV